MKLFIHIPKNGGMSIRHGMKGRIILAGRANHISAEYSDSVLKAMNESGEHHGYEHARWRDVRTDIRENHEAFCVVRNPYSRVVSRYTFARITGDSSGQKSFRKFLDERHRYGGMPYFWHRGIRGWYPQKDYITDDEGQVRVTAIRFATPDVEQYLGLKAPLVPRNVSNRGEDYRTFYGPEEYDIVTDWYRGDIDHFGFTFEGGATRNVWKPSS